MASLRADVVVDGQADLLHVVDALGAAGRLAGRLHGWQEQRDQDGNDGDDDQQFDEGETLGLRISSHVVRLRSRE